MWIIKVFLKEMVFNLKRLWAPDVEGMQRRRASHTVGSRLEGLEGGKHVWFNGTKYMVNMDS